MDDILLAARNGDNGKFAELLRQYTPLIDSMCDKYRGLSGGSDREDYRQEACLAFYHALLSYDTDKKEVTFGLYAKICIRNRMVSLLRKEKAKERHIVRADRVSGASASPVFSEAVEERDALLKRAASLLSGREREIFLLYINGKSYRHIADSLGITEKSVDNALFRAKKKLRGGFGKS